MEVLSLRFPHLIENIFCELDNQNLVDFRKVNRTFRSFIDNGRFRWIRIIRKFIGNISNLHKESWKKVLHKAPTQNIQELGKAVKKFFEVRKSRIQVNLCQKLLFLYQLTHNMTTDYSLNYMKILSLENVVYTNYFLF